MGERRRGCGECQWPPLMSASGAGLPLGYGRASDGTDARLQMTTIALSEEILAGQGFMLQPSPPLGNGIAAEQRIRWLPAHKKDFSALHSAPCLRRGGLSSARGRSASTAAETVSPRLVACRCGFGDSPRVMCDQDQDLGVDGASASRALCLQSRDTSSSQRPERRRFPRLTDGAA